MLRSIKLVTAGGGHLPLFRRATKDRAPAAPEGAALRAAPFRSRPFPVLAMCHCIGGDLATSVSLNRVMATMVLAPVG